MFKLYIWLTTLIQFPKQALVLQNGYIILLLPFFLANVMYLTQFMLFNAMHPLSFTPGVSNSGYRQFKMNLGLTYQSFCKLFINYYSKRQFVELLIKLYISCNFFQFRTLQQFFFLVLTCFRLMKDHVLTRNSCYEIYVS